LTLLHGPGPGVLLGLGPFFILFGQNDQNRVDTADRLTDTPDVGCG